MGTEPRWTARPDGAAEEPAERGQDHVVRVGWQVDADYAGLPVERVLVTEGGEPLAYVRYVVLPAPAWRQA